MGVLDKINGRSGFDEQENLSGLLGNGGWLLRSGGLGTEKKREHEKGGDRGAAHNNFSRKKDFLRRFVPRAGQKAGAIRAATGDCAADLVEPFLKVDTLGVFPRGTD